MTKQESRHSFASLYSALNAIQSFNNSANPDDKINAVASRGFLMPNEGNFYI